MADFNISVIDVDGKVIFSLVASGGERYCEIEDDSGNNLGYLDYDELSETARIIKLAAELLGRHE